MNSLLPLVLIGVMIIGFYFLVLRPAKRRQVEAQKTISQVEPGSEIMTTAGIYGTVVAVDDDTVDLEVAPGVTIKYARAAVARILNDETTDATDDEPALASDSEQTETAPTGGDDSESTPVASTVDERR